MQESEDDGKNYAELDELVEAEFDVKVMKIGPLTGFENLNFKVETEHTTFVLKSYTNLKLF